MAIVFQLAVGKQEAKKLRREEGEKISLRFPQTFEATTLFSIYINCKRSLLAWLVQIRKPLDGAYAPSMAPRAAGPEAINWTT